MQRTSATKGSVLNSLQCWRTADSQNAAVFQSTPFVDLWRMLDASPPPRLTARPRRPFGSRASFAALLVADTSKDSQQPPENNESEKETTGKRDEKTKLT